MLVYSILNPKSLEQLKQIRTDIIRMSIDGTPQKPAIIIGNKKDMETDREVPYADGHNFASKSGYQFIEVSAKTGENITDAFHMITREILKYRESLPELKKKKKKDRKNCLIL